MTESYAQVYRKQKLKFYKRLAEEMKEKLNDDPWEFQFNAEKQKLKDENPFDVSIIDEAFA